MIARADGVIVLVADAIPGERVRAKVEKTGRGVIYAQTIGVDVSSPDRRASDVDPACGGCLYAHIAYGRQIELKSLVIADAFKRIGRMELPAAVTVAPSPEDGYRMRARLHARDGRIGFYREGTHQLCEPGPTRQLLPATVDILARLGAALAPILGDPVREVILAENIDAGERVIGLDMTHAIDTAALAPLIELDGLTGVVAAGAAVRGVPHVVDRLDLGATTIGLQRHVLAFFQGNRYLFRDLVSHVTALVSDGASVLDLYAGGGAFAVGVASARRAKVTAVEGDRLAAADLMANSAAVHGAIRPERESVEAFLARERERPDVAIADPPRTGMSRESVAGIIRLSPARIVYVSCDAPTLARDARLLVDAGYAIEQAHAFDLFPNTPHVETVVVFNRR
jgi:23S rRNA (uracil1939-C5)-methyltransferase